MDIPQYNTDLVVRLAKPEEEAAVARLGVRAFNCNALDWYTPGKILVGEDQDGKLVTGLHCTPRPMWWGDAAVPASAVGGVATDPDERKKGYAGALMVGAIHHLREQGYCVCPLWPFSFAYYRKYGWEQTCRDLRVRAWPDMLRTIEERTSGIRVATPDDKAGLEHAYTAAAQLTNCQSVRDGIWWDEQKPPFYEKCLADVDEDGAIDGFLVYDTQPRHMASGVNVEVKEIQGASFAVQRSLMREAAEIDGADTISFLLPGDSLLPDLFPNYVAVESCQRLMVRVLDVAKALAHLQPAAELCGTVAYEIRDWVVSRETPVRVCADIESGGVEASSTAHPDALRMSINTFSRLYCGGMTVAHGRALGVIEGGSGAMDAMSDALLYGRTPFRSTLEPW